MLRQSGIAVTVLCLLGVIFSSGHAQQDTTERKTTPLGGLEVLGGRLDYYLLQPGGFLYFDMGEDSPPDSAGVVRYADFFHDGSSGISVQMIGLDLFWGKRKIRGGITAGLGVSLNTFGDNGVKQDFGIGGYAALKLGAALSLNEIVRIEIGFCLGRSARESFERKTDLAFYMGISFPTKLGDALKDWLD